MTGFAYKNQPGRWCIPGICSHRDCLMLMGLPEKAFVGFQGQLAIDVIGRPQRMTSPASTPP